jgi:hypothetical protein
MRVPHLPTDRHDIEAVVAAYDRANPDERLPRQATRLLAIIFPSEDICRRSLDDIAAEAECDRARLPRALRRLVEAQLLSRERGSGTVPHTYRLHLPRRLP